MECLRSIAQSLDNWPSAAQLAAQADKTIVLPARLHGGFVGAGGAASPVRTQIGQCVQSPRLFTTSLYYHGRTEAQES